MSMKRFVDIFFCHFLYHVKYKGLENLKLYDNYLICPNHSRIYDPFFIYPKTDNLYIMAKSEIFKHKLFAKFLKHYHVFPVNRNKKDPGSLLYALDIFKEKDAKLLIFPEGKVIKKDSDIKTSARNGACFISAKLNIPIIPTYITRRPRYFSKVLVTFGKPIFIPKDVINNKTLLKTKSKELIDIIYELNK